MQIIITSPSLETNYNVSGISAITNFIIKCNTQNKYFHFELGRRDNEPRNLLWLLRILKVYTKWGHVLLRQRDKVIHFNIALDKLSLIRDTPLIVTGRIFRRRMILHLHGGELLRPTETPRWINYLLKVNFGGTNPKIVLSELEKDVLNRKLSNNKIFVLPNCIALNEALLFDRAYPKDELLIILFMGRISLNKGIDLIFQALESLQTQGTQFKFVMAGRGPDEKIYVPKFRALLRDDFEFKGVVSGQNKIDLLKHCNIFLLPSLFEGLPMALLESMSFGLVPITTNVGSIKTVVIDGSNGMIINKHSSEEIERALVRLITDKQYMQELSRNARQYIFNHYKEEVFVNTLNSIYQY